jgi:colanic acid biosynthesis glycosyl transferase WcaI
MLASGRPVVVQASGGELVRAARVAGIAVPPGDPAVLAAAVRQLAADPARRHRLGVAARQFALDHLERDLVLSGYESRLLGLCAGRRPARWRQRLPAAAARGLADARAVAYSSPPLTPHGRR